MISHYNHHTQNVPPLSSLQKNGYFANKANGTQLRAVYQFTDKPEHIPHFQKCLHGGNEQAGPTGSASYAAGCPVYKSDGSLQSTKHFFYYISELSKETKTAYSQLLCPQFGQSFLFI